MSRPKTCKFFTFHVALMFRFKSILILHFLSVCVVSAVGSGERVGLSAICPPEAAMMKIDENRRK